MAEYGRVGQARDWRAVDDRHFTPAPNKLDSELIKDYTTEPERVQAARVSAANMVELAQWCGGEVSSVQTDEGDVQVILVPTLAGVLKVRIGDILARRKATGRFEVLSQQEFARFKVTGMRDRV